MQTASAEFDDAINSPTVVLVGAKVYADWNQDGTYDENSIEDLTRQVGDSLKVTQSFDDGMPSGLTNTTGNGVSTLDFSATGIIVSGASFSGSQYFSPLRSDSPIYGYARDVAPMKVEQGIVTSAGPETIRIFTGKMTNTPVDGREASVTGISATRIALSQVIRLPAVIGYLEGLETEWPILYALAACGFYQNPPPRIGCRLWMPMCGSIHPMIPSDNSVHTDSIAPLSRYIFRNPNKFRPDGEPSYLDAQPFIDGPHGRAPALYVRNDEVLRIGNYVEKFWITTPSSSHDDDLFSQTANKGRFECWVKSDNITLPSSPPPTVSYLMQLYINYDPGNEYIQCVITTDYDLIIGINDGTGPPMPINIYGPSIPNDGQWHFVGFAWDISNDQFWITLDNTSPIVSGVGVSTVNLAITEPDLNTTATDSSFDSLIPISDVQLTAGVNANPTVTPLWINDVNYFDPTSPDDVKIEVVSGNMNMTALAETKPIEAWSYIGSIAQTELAAIRTDENDKFCYLGQQYWAQDAQQTVVDTLNTATNVGDLDVTLDYTRVHNVANISYTNVIAGENWSHVYRQTAVIRLPILSTLVFQCVPQSTVVLLYDYSIATVTGGTEPTTSYITANNIVDGTGVYGTSADVSATVVSWTPGEIIIAVTNHTLTVWYLANNLNWATIAISGSAIITGDASVVVEDDVSIAARGYRAVDVSLPQLQDRSTANKVGQYIVDHFGQPLARIEETTVFGDPRRQPGDLITFSDAENTGADGNWRLMAIEHNKGEGTYTQRIKLEKTYPTGIWISDSETDPSILAQASVWDGDTVWADEV